MRIPRKAPARGFTLVELVVGLVVALLVFSAVTEAMVQVDNFRRITVAKAELDRDLQLALGWLRRDIAAVGVGNAVGQRTVNTNLGGDSLGTYPASLVPAILDVAAARSAITNSSLLASQFLIMADVPRPDTNFDGFSLLSDETLVVSGGEYPSLPVLNELNGRRHTTATLSSSDPRPGALDPTATCSSGVTKGCPYAFRKYSTNAGSEVVQVVAPSGAWQNTLLSSFNPASTNYTTTPPTLEFSSGPSAEANRPYPMGRVMQLDRIGYRINSSVSPVQLQRRQCWGEARPDTSGFGNFTNNCGTDEDTGWQTIARNVATGASKFVYLDEDGISTAVPNDTRMIEVNLELMRQVKVGQGIRYVRTKALEKMLFPRL